MNHPGLSRAAPFCGEYAHDSTEYDQGGIKNFLVHVRAYLHGRRTIPVSGVSSTPRGPRVTLTFVNDLLHRFLVRDAELLKSYDVTMKYGFGGFSRGGKNGIFYQRPDPHDLKLRAATRRFVRAHQTEVMEDLLVGVKGLATLRPVKVVQHDPSGRRLVGVLNPATNRIIFVGFAVY